MCVSFTYILAGGQSNKEKGVYDETSHVAAGMKCLGDNWLGFSEVLIWKLFLIY